MSGFSGFNFGKGSQNSVLVGTGTQELRPTTAQKTVSFNLPLSSQSTTLTGGSSNPASGGFSLGGASTGSSTFGFGGLGPKPNTTSSTANTGLFFGTSAGTSTTSLGATTTSGKFAFGALSRASTTAPSSVNFGVVSSVTNPTPALNLGGIGATSTTTTSGVGGFSFGNALNTTASTTTTPSTSGFSFGNAVNTSTPGVGLSLGNTTLGLGATTSQASTLSQAAATVAPKIGLGGLDPTTTSTASGAVGSGGKSNTKSAKEEQIPGELIQDITKFKKFLKDQKDVREKIARVSSREISGIQEEVNSLRKMLAVVSNGVQRSVAAVEKLKAESAMELKHAEIAQRTRDTPPGLQYENVAPTMYFHRLVDDFESHMTAYRQQIEEMESYLVALHQPGLFTPQELNTCLKKLHETFVALAAQLHGVHEAVKAQKEQYLNYRKAIHGDTTNVFEARKKMAEKTRSSRSVSSSVGPTPFAGLTNPAAAALALSLQRPVQTQAQSVTGLPTASNTGTLFGGSTTLFTNTGTGGFSFGSSKPSGAGTGLFGNATGLSGGSTGFSLGSAPASGSTSFSFGQTNVNKGFQLQSPPTGNKRGKRS